MNYKNSLKRRLFMGIAFLVIGIACGVLYLFKLAENAALLGLAIGFSGYGIGRVIDYIKKTRNEDSINKSYIEEHDERNRMLSGQAKCTAFDLSAFAGAIISIIFVAIGWDERGLVLGCMVCAMVFIYFICYMVYTRKY
ncbi:MAG: hypothetical protein IJI39_00805 [Clostridia bacterium]|nr:hypothetical protein [Clostridia bacterium]MBR0470234.1 hypothetical protein [Clostridia bacterium]